MNMISFVMVIILVHGLALDTGRSRNVKKMRYGGGDSEEAAAEGGAEVETAGRPYEYEQSLRAGGIWLPSPMPHHLGHMGVPSPPPILYRVTAVAKQLRASPPLPRRLLCI
ncbi:unnamed protein product [Cuscuta campestris]|uniref:Secreted protein n=2 Tax=Cuscuta sect. Cleistogrammica TaxID=1824901 RepID=A0A484KQG6_9ASTE|nr:hypothetical protein DM860_010712 [Cuscuta australis]VFQ68201.1 unnamed protein product [Cuscuta campestris]